MAIINNNHNVGPSLAEFHAYSDGTNNVGELRLADGRVSIVNNHVWKTGQNNTHLNADENRAVRTALYNALAQDIGEAGNDFLAKAKEVLLGGKNAERSLTREVARKLYDAEQFVKGGVDDEDRSVRTKTASDILDDSLKSLDQRNVKPEEARGVMKSSRDAAFRLTVNERCDKLRDLLDQFYPSPRTDMRNARYNELKTLFFGKDAESAALASQKEENPKFARYHKWLSNFDAKAQDSDGGSVSDDKALKDLAWLLKLDCITQFTLSADKRSSAVTDVLNDLFGGKGGMGQAMKANLLSLLSGGKESVNDGEQQIADFRSWLSGSTSYSPGGENIPDDEAVSKLRELLLPLSEGIEALPVEDRRNAVNAELDRIFDGKGGVGKETKARLATLLFGAESPQTDKLTDDEKQIVEFRAWVSDFNAAATDGDGKTISDKDGRDRLKTLLEKVGDGVKPIGGNIRTGVVNLVLEQCGAKGGYGQAMRARLHTLLFGTDIPDKLTDDEAKIVEFRGWAKDFNQPMKDEAGRVMSDREASKQLQALLQKVNDGIEPMSQNERETAVDELLQKHFYSQGGMGRMVGKYLERILDKTVKLEDLSADESQFPVDRQKLLAFREWKNDFSAAVKGEDGMALPDKEALERLTKQLEEIGQMVKPMSVQDRQKAAAADLEEAFKSAGGYGRVMKERLHAILLGREDVKPESFTDETENSLAVVFRKWLHDFEAVAENTEGGERRLMLFDSEGRLHLQSLLKKVADGINPMPVVDRQGKVQNLLKQGFFEKGGNGTELGNRLNAIFDGTQQPADDTERGIARFGNWLRDFDVAALDENGQALSDESALQRLDALLQKESLKLLSPAEMKKREVLDVVDETLKNRQQQADSFWAKYEKIEDDLAGQYDQMDVAEVRALAWWKFNHYPDFEQLWSEAVDAGRQAILGMLTDDVDQMEAADLDSGSITPAAWENLDLEEAKEAFDEALDEALNAPLKELNAMVETVRGYSTSEDMKSMLSSAQEECGRLLDEMGATPVQKQRVLEALPAELRSLVYHCEETRGDGLSKSAEPKVTLYDLIEGGEKGDEVVDHILGDLRFRTQRLLMEMRETEVEELIQGRQRDCLQQGREQALRQIVGKLSAFDNMTLTDEDLERSVGSHPGLRKDDVAGDVRRLFAEQSEKLRADFAAEIANYVEKGGELPSGLAGSDAFGRLTESVANALVEKFAGVQSGAVSGDIAAYANQIRDERSAEFAKSLEIDNLGTRLTQGVVDRLVGHFEDLLGAKNADKSLFWLSSDGKSAKFDENLKQQLIAYLKKPVMVHMSRVYANGHAVTEKDVEQKCDYIFVTVRNLLKGFSALYRNLAVDKKNFISHATVFNRDVVVAKDDEAKGLVRGEMKREALETLRAVMENLDAYLNDPEDVKMKKVLADAAGRVLGSGPDDPLYSLWHTHEREDRNVKVREGLLNLA